MHLQAITTKFLGPTDTRGSRVKATAGAGSITVGWDYALNSRENHAAAAQALARKMEWTGAWVSGGLPDGKGDVFVCIDPRAEPAFTVTY